MKVSGIISFILKLLGGIALIFTAMDMPSVLKLAGTLMVFGVIAVVLSIPEFILALKNKGKLFGAINIVSLGVSIIFFILSRSSVSNDYLSNPGISLAKVDYIAFKIFIFMLVIEVVLGIVNIILGFTNKKEN